MKRDNLKLYMMTAPGLLIFFSMSIFPVIFTIFTSFFKWQGLGLKMKWFGFGNYLDMFTDERFLNALKNNVIWIIGFLLIPLVLGFFLALLLDQDIRGESIFKSIIYYPGVVSFVILGIVFSLIFNYRHGLVNEIFKMLHLDIFVQNWLGNQDLALPVLILLASWQYIGFVMIIFLAGIRNISKDILEAADIDGAGFFRKIFYVIIPALRPVITVVTAITLINSIKVFDIVFVMTRGGPERSTDVLGYVMYEVAFLNSEWGRGSAYGTLIFILTTAIGLVYINQMMKGEER